MIASANVLKIMLYKMSTKRINTLIMKVRINYTVFDKSTSLDSMESKPSKLFDRILNIDLTEE